MCSCSRQKALCAFTVHSYMNNKWSKRIGGTIPEPHLRLQAGQGDVYLGEAFISHHYHTPFACGVVVGVPLRAFHVPLLLRTLLKLMGQFGLDVRLVHASHSSHAHVFLEILS
ncbi:hypothetical protein TRVL_05792 [Trypanosoma vivax]|nr:hypothetical protein TRVL_05792 [Trypanosoma vivax]